MFYNMSKLCWEILFTNINSTIQAARTLFFLRSRAESNYLTSLKYDDTVLIAEIINDDGSPAYLRAGMGSLSSAPSTHKHFKPLLINFRILTILKFIPHIPESHSSSTVR